MSPFCFAFLVVACLPDARWLGWLLFDLHSSKFFHLAHWTEHGTGHHSSEGWLEICMNICSLITPCNSPYWGITFVPQLYSRLKHRSKSSIFPFSYTLHFLPVRCFCSAWYFLFPSLSLSIFLSFSLSLSLSLSSFLFIHLALVHRISCGRNCHQLEKYLVVWK